MANLYLVKCKGNDDSWADAFLVLANSAPVAVGLGGKAYAEQGGDLHVVSADELIGGESRVVSLEPALAKAGLILSEPSKN